MPNTDKLLTYKELRSLIKEKYIKIKGTTRRAYISVGCHGYVGIYGRSDMPFWLWRDRKTNFHYISDFSTMTLAQARAKCQMLYDDDYSKSAQKIGYIQLFQDFAKKYLLQKKDLVRFPTEKTYVLKLFPLFKRPINELTNIEIKEFLLNGNFSAHTRHMLLHVIICIMDIAAEEEVLDQSTYRALKKSKDFAAPQAEGFRWLPLEKLQTQVFANMVNMPITIQMYFLMQILLCLRPRECRMLKHQYFDLVAKKITIPRSEMKIKDKKRGDFEIPISRQVENLYNKVLKNRVGDTEFLFTNAKGKVLFPYQITNSLKLCCGGIVTPHGFRKTARSWMAEQEVNLETAMMCLDHQLQVGADALYQRSNLYKNRIPVMQQYADAVTAVLPAPLQALLS